MKHGYTSVETFKAEGQKKFSLVETGILEQPATKLLLVNVGAPVRLVDWGWC